MGCLWGSVEVAGRPDLAVTHFRYVELLQHTGDQIEAHEQLDQASSLFREMEMTGWLEQAEELGKTLSVG